MSIKLSEEQLDFFFADIDECATNTANCQQICTNTIGSFNCSCNPGFSTNVTNTSLCDDIDECATNTSTCQQICMNTIGSFRCSCHPGFSINVMNTSLCDVQLKVILRLSVISDDVNLSDQEIREKFRQFLQGNGRMPSI
ncbi:hypothetical protein scyTo_0015748 [Scyliorhinus torazame]|uniref:EGF-like domain-containing protein n=1 Tax=Scyliorhinus torazame TaxID=75743 RepID=A0A401PY73_SCYTO|nr:hypothetical protein [Scyliorhinus torazame]